MPSFTSTPRKSKSSNHDDNDLT
uniref:Uncharacterized protein n=1 Tax=Arundo donax TaxID=35708 RepID=A0A0A9BN77_ARUDO